MAIRKILTEPDPFLRQISYEVEKVDDEVQSRQGGNPVELVPDGNEDHIGKD